MKVIILGDGLLGNEIHLQTSWDLASRKTSGFNIEGNFNKLQDYDVIVNCIAHTDTYSKNKELHWKVNCEFLDCLIDYCNLHKKKLVHISTDYVYTHSERNASEDSVPVHLQSWYGYTKLLGDGLVQLRCKDYLICRLSHKPYPFPYENAWTDIRTNCDFVNIIANLVVSLIIKKARGVFNVGTEEKSIYDLVKNTKDVDKSYKPTHVPADTTMDLTKLNRFLRS